ncbi:hypothetical protein [Nocardia jiangxiensis]|uniref:hypothetical protein n=1 Tax=Nocardia jiangxiensis TaxID=282685 RepID=UPI000686145E|nr:hypothetical protein [Nocardia jiangxiensis]
MLEIDCGSGDYAGGDAVTECRKCGAAVTRATLPNGMTIDLEPPRDIAQVLVVDGNAMFLQGRLIGEARRNGLQVMSRHGVYCARFWDRTEED